MFENIMGIRVYPQAGDQIINYTETEIHSTVFGDYWKDTAIESGAPLFRMIVNKDTQANVLAGWYALWGDCLYTREDFDAAASRMDAFKLPEQAEPLESVTFGHFEQDGDLLNGTEPIEWLILEKSGDSALVVSKKVLYKDSFSNAQTWMNGVFDQIALSKKEREATYIDEQSTPSGNQKNQRIFILSETEFNSYLAGTPNAIAQFTPFVNAAADGSVAKQNAPGAVIYGEDMISYCIIRGDKHVWWLRTALPYVDPYDGGFEQPSAKIVVGDRSLASDWIGNAAGVRPAMWVKLGKPDPELMEMPSSELEVTSQPIPQGDVTDWY